MQRANEAEQYYKEIYLKREPYNHKVSKAGIARVREKNQELGRDIVHGYRTDNERVNEVVEFNAQRDSTVTDNKMIYFPKWKSDEKEKFVSVVRHHNLETVQTCQQQL